MTLDLRPSQMSQQQFVTAFATVFENSAWVAEAAWASGINAEHDTPEALAQAMTQMVKQASTEKQMALIMEHPILGTTKKMGEASTCEQQSANLQDLSDVMRQQLQALNQTYIKKFNIPFIVAVRAKDPDIIMQNLQQRLQNTNAQDEIACALEQIYKIAYLRLQALWQ